MIPSSSLGVAQVLMVDLQGHKIIRINIQSEHVRIKAIIVV